MKTYLFSVVNIPFALQKTVVCRVESDVLRPFHVKKNVSVVAHFLLLVF